MTDFAGETGSPALAALAAAQLLGERAALNRFCIPGLVSAGGGCRLYRASDGWVALNLARPDDLALLPALFGDADLADAPVSAASPTLAARIARTRVAPLVAQGRELGLAIAGSGEAAPAAVALLAEGAVLARPPAPLVLDLSALWAGPLAGHLLWLAGATVVKVESPRRPDTMREGDPALFARLNQGKASVALDATTSDGRAALLGLIARADIVIEAARPRALAQLGVDASALVRARTGNQQPGRPLVWLSITGHGTQGDAAGWVGFGDDCGVAGGLTDALIAATGQPGFVGDAIGDPLAGIRAAGEAWRAWRAGQSCRIGLAMSGVVAEALAAERAEAPRRLTADLVAWGQAAGQPFAATEAGAEPRAALSPFGADTADWLGGAAW